jgi:hypothetical protein
VILDLTGTVLRRTPGDLDFSDLTNSRLTGEPLWLDENRLDLPFTPDPSPAEKLTIRRRLLTRDRDEETRVGQYLAAANALANSTTTEGKALRLLILERLRDVKEA